MFKIVLFARFRTRRPVRKHSYRTGLFISRVSLKTGDAHFCVCCAANSDFSPDGPRGDNFPATLIKKVKDAILILGRYQVWKNKQQGFPSAFRVIKIPDANSKWIKTSTNLNAITEAHFLQKQTAEAHLRSARKFAFGKLERTAQAITNEPSHLQQPPVLEAHFTETDGGGRTSDLLASLPPAKVSGLHNQLQTCKAICSSPPCSRSALYRGVRRRPQLGAARTFAFGKSERTAQAITNEPSHLQQQGTQFLPFS